MGVDSENTWAADKKEWCCRVHHRGCPSCHQSCRLRHPPQQTHTTVLMDLQIGRQDGACRKRSGAAGFMARVAPVSSKAGVHLWGPPLRCTTAMLGSPIGWQVGQ